MRLGTPHHWQTHGGYSLLRAVTKGELDGRSAVAQAIKTMCHQLARDLGSGWATLSAQQRLLCESVATKATVLSLMVGHALSHDVVEQDGKLRPPLGGHFLAWSNSLRLDLQALGLERRLPQVLDLTKALLAAEDGPPQATESSQQGAASGGEPCTPRGSGATRPGPLAMPQAAQEWAVRQGGGHHSGHRDDHGTTDRT